MNSDGSMQRRLTSLDSAWPAWSPDGRRIAFVAFKESRAEIWVMNPDGSRPTRLTAGRTDGHPIWSPDGRLIVFTSTATAPAIGWDVYIMSADGSNQKRLARIEGAIAAYDPVWSPDGQRLAIDAEVNFTEQIFLINLTDGRMRQLTDSGRNHSPIWSPDGRRIVFAADLGVGCATRPPGCSRLGTQLYPQLYVMNVDGSERTQMTTKPANLFPAWSPDGRRIAFASSRDNDWQIFVMNADGSGQRRITSLDEGISPTTLTWSPDSQQIAFVSLVRSPLVQFPGGTSQSMAAQIFVTDADGGRLKRLTGTNP